MNPNFNIPQGLALSYDPNYQFAGNDEQDGGGGDDQIFPPQTFTIVSQEMRYADDGTLVVDIIAEVEDIDGIVKYDVRIAKE